MTVTVESSTVLIRKPTTVIRKRSYPPFPLFVVIYFAMALLVLSCGKVGTGIYELIEGDNSSVAYDGSKLDCADQTVKFYVAINSNIITSMLLFVVVFAKVTKANAPDYMFAVVAVVCFNLLIALYCITLGFGVNMYIIVGGMIITTMTAVTYFIAQTKTTPKKAVPVAEKQPSEVTVPV